MVKWIIGSDPLWPWPLGPIYTYRTRRYHAVCRTLAEKEDVVFVNLFKERADDIFAKDPERYHAKDGLHLSDDGYEVWYESLKEAMGQ